jgi:ankyrin repeat protein
MQAADAEVAQLLLDAGADAGRADQDGWTALHYAATRESNAGLVELLIQAGAGVNARTSRGETPLRLAGILFTEKICPAWGETLIALLVQKGADIDSSDLEGHTLLHQAAFNDNAELAAVCLRHGGNPDQETAAARTPRQVAQELGSKKFLQVMEK